MTVYLGGLARSRVNRSVAPWAMHYDTGGPDSVSLDGRGNVKITTEEMADPRLICCPRVK